LVVQQVKVLPMELLSCHRSDIRQWDGVTCLIPESGAFQVRNESSKGRLTGLTDGSDNLSLT
jgi:hypothetical protein